MRIEQRADIARAMVASVKGQVAGQFPVDRPCVDGLTGFYCETKVATHRRSARLSATQGTIMRF
ncbi:MAG TPA: hypothetical protein VMV78_13840 [Thiobacillus sp.]|nr:hypothetical protein [Thiobacillus sp.]